MARTVVGLFDHVSEAQSATEQLLAAGFQRTGLHLATQDTLRAEHLAATETEAPAEPLGTGFIRFFTDLFAGNENADAQAHIAAARADSAVLTVEAATEDQANRARTVLDANGAVDVYKQAPARSASPGSASAADDAVDLEGSLSRVRDSDSLDANGLTTH
ncbi:hypothetical protein JAO73_13125 [Hymenobacter sp. BT523]|uniref:hypothetical protein n=1 Tax=Hymenobacter sp. BT523 TaxID=2795725 RepID=UPI0018ED3BE0|nr:hypothetical protein [Hymenobacter sp. BT523]MBJ6109958.1 hypothetical protein [Hymenobacter sp. BT523]